MQTKRNDDEAALVIACHVVRAIGRAILAEADGLDFGTMDANTALKTFAAGLVEMATPEEIRKLMNRGETGRTMPTMN